MAYIYSSTFFFDNEETTHLTIKGTTGSYAESYLKEYLPQYNDYTYDGDMFTAKVSAVSCSHAYGGWFNVGSSHRRVCSKCGSAESVAHTWDGGTVTKNATCKEEGIMTYTCTVCGATSAKSIAKTDTHTWGTSFKVDGSSHKHSCTVCGKEEVSGHTYDHDCDPECNDCGASRETTHAFDTTWSWDEANHWHSCRVCGTANNPVAHDFENDCATLCLTCGYVRENAHVYYSDWQADENGHWKICRICGTASEIEAHIPNGEATEDAAKVCTLCNYELAPATGHSFREGWSSDEDTICDTQETEGSQGLSPAVQTALIVGLAVTIGGGVIGFFIWKKKHLFGG